jgi:hypothetical protein
MVKKNKKIAKKLFSNKTSFPTRSLVKTESKSKKGKKNTPAYYDCVADSSRKGKCGNITKCTHDCKEKAPSLALQRAREIEKFANAYYQMGESVKSLFGHFFGNNGKVKGLR